MRSSVLASVSVCVLLVVGFLVVDIQSTSARGSGARFEAHLSGDQEVPNAVETDTCGSFKIRFNRDLDAATIRLRIRDGVRVTQAHLHCAAEGENGPVIIFLAGFHDLGWDIDGTWIKNATVTDENITNTACGETLEEIVDEMEAGNVYVNVHTVANPGGEIRGQLED